MGGTIHGKHQHKSSQRSGTGYCYRRNEALSVALNAANLTRDSIDLLKKVKLDYEHGRKVYEIEFYQGGFEYEFDIDAATGAILKSKKDWD